MVKELKTENRIVEAAKAVFIKKGMDGARMQEIANEAGINKALLHYYFRTKDKLFEKVFSIAFKEVFTDIYEAIYGITDFEEFLESFIRNYILFIKQRPFIPSFVIHELNRNPDRIVPAAQPALSKWLRPNGAGPASRDRQSHGHAGTQRSDLAGQGQQRRIHW